MMPKAEDIRRYIFRPTDTLLLDANVWLYIYGPSKPGDWKGSVYSRALKEMLKAGSQIYIDVLVLSEFINSYARTKKGLSRSPLSFKQFRQSPHFTPLAQAIAGDARRILQICNHTESGFSTLDVAALVGTYEGGAADFNDLVLTNLCQRNGWKLVTHDGDFKRYGLPLVTANSYLLT